MKRIIFLLLGACLCACGRYGCGVPAGYEPLLDAALAGCPRADSLRQLLRQTPREQREGMAFLIAHMPRGDRDTMRLDLLRENVEYAYRARREYPWTRALPDSVFLNEVLPYAAVDEVRDSWRADFYPRFARRVALCRDIRAAIDSVNRNIAADVGVEYNTAREKTNQSPAESMRQHMASCTGLSVLLVDALRAAGIPARFAGTPAWHDDRGNHSWTEVWIDGEWHFTEFYQPAALDRAWFLADAGQATPGDRQHAVYAVSFAPTGDWFPMVWNETSREVSLSGEAYFEVARHAALPFRVEARGCTFTVLGTKFDISAYAEDPAVTAALLEGALRFESEDKQEAMTPGDLVTYDCATATVRREQVDVRQYRAWIDGVIRYDAITLPSLLRRLAREYDVEIDLRTRRFDDTTFRISLSSAQNIKSVMRALCDILPISVSCEGCRYVVDALPQ